MIILLYFGWIATWVMSITLMIFFALEEKYQEYAGVSIIIGILWPVSVPILLVFTMLFALNEGVKSCTLYIKNKEE